MATFRKARELLIASFDDGDISEDEFLLLYDANISKNLDYPYQNYEDFDLEGLGESECLAEFRFRKRDIPILADVMGLPDSYRCEQGTVCDGIEGLCLLLRRLAYPCRYSDLIHRFGRPVPEICMITNYVMETVYSLHHHRLTAWNHTLMSPPHHFNKSMSSVRISVEWLFGDIVNYFKFVDFKKTQKISLSALGKMYIVCAILRNAMTCLYGNFTSNFFDIDPPTLQDYFS